MPVTIARIKKFGKLFEIYVELDDAVKFKKGESAYIEAQGDKIFKDAKKGDTASSKDLKECFGTENATEIAKKIVKDGEIQLTQEFRDEEKEKRYKQVVEFLSKNATDPQ
jgi:ribosome maturation protein SDO1